MVRELQTKVTQMQSTMSSSEEFKGEMPEKKRQIDFTGPFGSEDKRGKERKIWRVNSEVVRRVGPSLGTGGKILSRGSHQQTVQCPAVR